MEPRHEQEIQANSAASTTHDQEELKNPSKNKKKSYIIIRQDEDIQRTSTQKKLPDSPPKCGCQKSIQGNCTDEKSPEFPPKKAGYPPGYRFMPTDDELILEYLLKKINNEPIPIAEITPVYLKQNNPKALAETHPKLGENEWYFFTPRDRKYPNGSRPNRAADTGYWKATGADKPVRFKDKVIGFRKALVFYEGKPPKGEKTSWIMHEFRVNQPSRSKRSADDMRLDDWVLCRIYEKASRPNNRNRRADDPVEDDENPLQVNTDDNDENSGVELNNENASPVVDSNENLAAFDMPENLAIGQHSDDEFRSFGDHWLQPSLHSLLISPPHSMDEPALINGHLQSSILDYGLVNPVGQVQQNAFRTTYLNEHEQAFGFHQGNFDDAAAAGSWVQENSGTFQQLPSYFGPSSSRNNTTNLYDHSLMKVEDPYSGIVTNNPDYNQCMPRKRRI